MTTSEQARADALADAETLRLMGETLWRDGNGADHIYSTEEEAAMLHYNLWQADTRRGGRVWRHRRYPTAVAERVFDAARAAFRAVPGLRGDR